MYKYRSAHWLPISIAEAWKFFSSPNNLSLITPPEMEFRILTTLESEIYEGMIIDYSVKPLFGIAVRWRTEICKVEAGQHFTDRQLKGPYKVWEHTHTFTESNGGVIMSDELKYQLHLSFVGRIAHHLFVRNKIESIFSYRRNALKRMFL